MNSRIRCPLYISLKSWLCCCSLPMVAPQQKYLNLNNFKCGTKLVPYLKARNQLAKKAQSFPQKASNTVSPMITRHTRDFTWNRGCSSNSPPIIHGDQIPHTLEGSDYQIPSSLGQQRCQMPGVCPGRGGGDVEASTWPIHKTVEVK